ncbi:NUDIX hydrolase [Fusibacter sp. JL216-2]|uniref:NUDIX hydrolase n=1 Tax=Fusibacter sp. JL216-2 TaxID=3071453 RepID=UPI003D3392E1
MKTVTSAGGVVFLGNSVLMLRKFNGDWVLPKGKVESGESTEQTALREVREETGVKGRIIEFLGETNYRFKNCWSQNEVIEKRVLWYIMEAKTTHTVPQKEEGFVEAKFIHINRIDETVKYDDEKDMIENAIRIYQYSKE